MTPAEQRLGEIETDVRMAQSAVVYPHAQARVLMTHTPALLRVVWLALEQRRCEFPMGEALNPSSGKCRNCRDRAALEAILVEGR